MGTYTSERDERWRTQKRRKNVDFIVGKGLLKKKCNDGSQNQDLRVEVHNCTHFYLIKTNII